jgi:hypothetical protein
MRKHNHLNISPFQYEEITRNAQGYANPIDFSAKTEDIIVLAFQPGLGKTHMVLEYMKTHPNSFYFTDRHNTIDENIKNWTNVPHQHWKGFSRRCSNIYLKNLQERYNLNPNVICNYSHKADVHIGGNLQGDIEYLLHMHTSLWDKY